MGNLGASFARPSCAAFLRSDLNDLLCVLYAKCLFSFTAFDKTFSDIGWAFFIFRQFLELLYRH